MKRCYEKHEVGPASHIAGTHWLWLANLTTCLTLLVWILLDASAGESWNALTAAANGTQLGELARLPFALLLMATLIGLSLLGMVCAWGSLTVGPRRYRSLLAWMVTIGLTSLWLGLIVNMPGLIWSGYRLRLLATLPHYEAVAPMLSTAWPSSDGENPAIGPYSAYPIAQPRTLLLLAPPEISPGTFVSSIERAESGGLRLELAGKERGVWLEWHPSGSAPSSFIGGLADPHTLEQASQLRDNWFVVRYK